nr:hypothetical protein CFP56_23547 [Quercus suber]
MHNFSPPYCGEEKMLLQLALAGKVWKRNRGGGRRHVQTTNRVNVVRGDNGGETIRGQIARKFRANVAVGEVGDTTGGQYSGEVRFDVAGDDDGGTINGEIAMGPTSLAATMPIEFN